eukprot:snap_masked-scaffold_7-processed-gene-7.29-mRNA-1 protein AED:1.00 eAED:1.00 QI:0/0/0/0/1/1/2/0/180
MDNIKLKLKLPKNHIIGRGGQVLDPEKQILDKYSHIENLTAEEIELFKGYVDLDRTWEKGKKIYERQLEDQARSPKNTGKRSGFSSRHLHQHHLPNKRNKVGFERKKLFVKKFRGTKKELEYLFTHNGFPVENVYTFEGKDYAFVSLVNEKDTTSATLRLNGQRIKGEHIIVQRAKRKVV